MKKNVLMLIALVLVLGACSQKEESKITKETLVLDRAEMQVVQLDVSASSRYAVPQCSSGGSLMQITNPTRYQCQWNYQYDLPNTRSIGFFSFSGGEYHRIPCSDGTSYLDSMHITVTCNKIDTKEVITLLQANSQLSGSKTNYDYYWPEFQIDDIPPNCYNLKISMTIEPTDECKGINSGKATFKFSPYLYSKKVLIENINGVTDVQC